jgi:hypothetical protein
MLILRLNFAYQSEEEAGSAEEQPASNKIDGYTIVRGVSNGSFTFYYRYPAWLRKLSRVIFKVQIPFYKVSFGF